MIFSLFKSHKFNWLNNNQLYRFKLKILKPVFLYEFANKTNLLSTRRLKNKTLAFEFLIKLNNTKKIT